MNTFTTASITLGLPEPTKKQIIQRLFKQGHISFNEMWTLLLDEPEVNYAPMPLEELQPPFLQPPYNPLDIQYDKSDRELHIPERGTGDITSP